LSLSIVLTYLLLSIITFAKVLKNVFVNMYYRSKKTMNKILLIPLKKGLKSKTHLNYVKTILIFSLDEIKMR